MIRNNQRKPGTIRTPHKLTCKSASIQNQQNQYHIEQWQSQQQNKMGSRASHQLSLSEVYPVEVGNSKVKEEIDLSAAGILNLQSELLDYPHLELVKFLDLSSNNLRGISSKLLSKMVTLSTLKLQNNCLIKFSFPYFKQHHLTILELSCNNIGSLNLEHISSLEELDCSKNMITLLTLPQNLIKLYANGNKLTNLYAIENCEKIEEVRVASNQLYDLKLTISRSRDMLGFEYLTVLDCSNNKIQHISGLKHAPNLSVLQLANNRLTVTRDTLSELLSLQLLTHLTIENNPIEEAGFSRDEIIRILVSRMEEMRTIDGEEVELETGRVGSERKSEYSGIMDEPYQLFMESGSMPANAGRNLQWNFTLGDCQNEQMSSSKINDLSLIESLNPVERLDMPPSHHHQQEPPSTNKPIDTPTKNILSNQSKDLKVKLIKSVSSSLSMPHHIHYHPFLKTLLPMSYIPAHPVFHNASKITSRRLDQDDDDYVLISKMFQNTGGVVYVKKVNLWMVHENNQQIYNRHGSSIGRPHMAFVLNELNQKQFRELCKYSKLIARNHRDVVGMQPNVFSCYHIIARINPYREQDQYSCAYLVQSAHL